MENVAELLLSLPVGGSKSVKGTEGPAKINSCHKDKVKICYPATKGSGQGNFHQ
jgi:hypothetical protein